MSRALSASTVHAPLRCVRVLRVAKRKKGCRRTDLTADVIDRLVPRRRRTQIAVLASARRNDVRFRSRSAVRLIPSCNSAQRWRASMRASATGTLPHLKSSPPMAPSFACLATKRPTDQLCSSHAVPLSGAINFLDHPTIRINEHRQRQARCAEQIFHAQLGVDEMCDGRT